MPDNRMIFTASECERHTLMPGKNTVIMATCQSPMWIFMTSVLSVLIKSNPSKVEHLIVCINGGDSRTGDTSLQDKKQAFLEDLRGLKWHGRDMPVTVIRAWSRIGHTQAVEMAIPWVHTELYTVMHDDVIIMSDDWADEAEAKLMEKSVAICQESPVLMMCTGEVVMGGKTLVNLPHVNSSLCVCNKRAITETGQRWYGYHFETKFVIEDKVDKDKFLESNARWSRAQNFVKTDKEYHGASVDVGGHIWSALQDRGYEIACFDSPKSLHLVGMSWCEPLTARSRLRAHGSKISSFREQLLKHKELKDVFERHGWHHAELL